MELMIPLIQIGGEGEVNDVKVDGEPLEPKCRVKAKSMTPRSMVTLS
jgi:hypothetical protein